MGTLVLEVDGKDGSVLDTKPVLDPFGFENQNGLGFRRGLDHHKVNGLVRKCVFDGVGVGHFWFSLWMTSIATQHVYNKQFGIKSK